MTIVRSLSALERSTMAEAKNPLDVIDKVGQGLAGFAGQLENVYFAAQRAGVSVANLKAVEYSAQSLGISAETASKSVESLARFMRNTTGGEGVVRHLGVRTRDDKGQMRDAVEIMVDLGGALAKQSAPAASKTATTLGIDDDMLQAMRSGQFAAQIQQFRGLTAGTRFDEAASSSHQFMGGLRQIQAMSDGIATNVGGNVVQRLAPQLAEVQAWFAKNGPQIETRLSEMAGAMTAAVEVATPMLLGMADTFLALDTATDGWSTSILAVGVGLKWLGAAEMVGGLKKTAQAVSELFGLIGGGAAEAGAAAGAGAGVGAGAAGLAARGLRMASFAARGAGVLGVLELAFHSGSLNTGEDAQIKAIREKEREASFDEATFRPPARDRALVDRLRASAARGVDSVRGAVGQLASPDGAPAATSFAGRLVADSGLALDIPGVPGRPARSGNPFVPSTVLGATGGDRAINVLQNNQTNINVSGVSDPRAAGRAVHDQQVSVNQAVTRNFQGALR